MPLARTEATFVSPIVESRRWLQGLTFSDDAPLLNLSQAAPADPPPDGLRQAMAEAVLHQTSAHLYGPVLGNDDLRAALAAQMSRHYDATVRADETAITSGCNQAFAATIASLSGEGDEVILPTPWYFNHKMWLDMQGVTTLPLPVGAGMLPEVARAEAMITERTRAIALVTPNNPCGVEYPADLLDGFFDLARRHGLTLIVDETYRDFDSRSGAPHRLFQTEGWQDTLVHLYSFSKAYRLTGHRVGAIATGRARLMEMEKFLDTVTICPAQVGQIGATWGIENLDQWLAGERAEILDRRAAIEEGFAPLAEKGWTLLGVGAYFAYVAHPFDQSADVIAQKLLKEAGVLLLPGTMFSPEDAPEGQRQFRVAFANVDRAGISEMLRRLADFTG
ncbi:aminotransferase [Phaeobacter sp. B1627]|uniref:aminotransferase n=1 Tax=Phaeobacter sp. B1627 TaxID=2583809 RepID=UPI001119C3CB|nr:aminotransferase [Phaeobacter sp. B1627]TNJ46885.1 aminotransferase [Phaeobacter sp. B1627]